MSAEVPATWRSGYAAVCKTVYAGSIPAVASIPLKSLSAFPCAADRLTPANRDSLRLYALVAMQRDPCCYAVSYRINVGIPELYLVPSKNNNPGVAKMATATLPRLATGSHHSLAGIAVALFEGVIEGRDIATRYQRLSRLSN